ncbi:hypothetical protein RC62_46 [Flavobacterium aquidurense]|uniref:Uncharacterized protein n=1 Tax=Flavobacterium aquidurense TaxID=362413 RepID=A0A0N8VP02_9FLAO|nr:hypothetical protein RC62_46 [Flavobacterium aquidurense]
MIYPLSIKKWWKKLKKENTSVRPYKKIFLFISYKKCKINFGLAFFLFLPV